MKRLATLSVLAAVGAMSLCGSASAGLISSIGDPTPNSSTYVADGVISGGEYSASYSGGGGGFGGTLGSGSLHMDTDGVNLYIAFQPGNALNDNVVIHLDTKSGGFTDAAMNDTADPGRNLLTNLTRDVDDSFPVLPDYGIVIGGFGIVSFELAAGSLPFIDYNGTFTGNNPALVREYAIPLSAIGSPTEVNFFVSYGSDTNFMSNESIPAEAFNAGGNPGFDNLANGGGPVARANYDQFVVPEPGSLALLGLAAVTGLTRRSRR